MSRCDHQPERHAPDLDRVADGPQQRQQLEVFEHGRRLLLQRPLAFEQRVVHQAVHRPCRSRSFCSSGASGP